MTRINNISKLTEGMFKQWSKDYLFAHQKHWQQMKVDSLHSEQRHRFISASRMTGSSHYFTAEAFEDAVINGNDQFFFTTSNCHSQSLFDLIKQHARYEFHIPLKSNFQKKPTDLLYLRLHKDGEHWATIYFISPETKKTTFAALHGNSYFEQPCWIPNFTKALTLAKGLSAHKKYSITYIHTGRWLDGPAWQLWNAKNDHIARHQTTAIDAVNQGCNLFDINQLKAEFSDTEFKQLFCCEFIEEAKDTP